MPGFTPSNADMGTVNVGDVLNDTITWSKTNFQLDGFRIEANEFPTSPDFSIVASTTDVQISGIVPNPWGYISAQYTDHNDTLHTMNDIIDPIVDLPNNDIMLHLVKLEYDSTPSQVFHFTVHADWSELDPNTNAPKVPAVTGTDTQTYFYTVLNNWTGNKNNFDTLKATGRIR